ncbi:TRAP transporter large permease [Petroclostridium xylanilyticum]|uniref:TRAP transporter large permease n=1 Tax=Petroclostridium xylanilyticum TaxID=1792311 RepID=UPI000B98E77C|nr:TRAP transporter large permease [Petroclostridium xylanilyticum]
MILTIFLGVLVLLFILGFSVPYAIGLTSLVVLIFQRGITEIPFGIISQRMVYGINNFTLLAIPFFLLAGKLMNTGSITKKIFKFANTLVGYLPGGLGHANIVASIIFAGMSGSAVADAAGLGTIEIEAMQDQGFDKEFSAAVTAASSTIGPIIPPSIPLIMYGVMGDVSIAALLLAGIVPGLLMGGAMMVLVAYYSIKRNYPKIPFPKWKEIWHDFKDAFWPLLTPVILIGGILSGIFTPTEASAVAVVYSFILTVFVYKELSVRDLINIFMETIKETAVILFIVAASSLYGYLLVKTQMPQYFMEKLFAVSQNPVIILLLINVFLLVIGCFMETNAAIIILTPMMIPLAAKLGIDPVHLGIVMVLNLMIGLLTPPIGMCLYAVARVAKLSLDKMVRAVAPFYIPLIVVLLLITLFPQIVLILPSLALGY